MQNTITMKYTIISPTHPKGLGLWQVCSKPWVQHTAPQKLIYRTIWGRSNWSRSRLPSLGFYCCDPTQRWEGRVCITLEITMPSFRAVGDGNQGRNWWRDHGGVLLTGLLAFFLLSFRTTCPGVAAPQYDEAFHSTHQSRKCTTVQSAGSVFSM